MSKVESFELFQKSLEILVPSAAAFIANRTSSHRGGGSSCHKRGCGNGSTNDFSNHEQGRATINQGRHPPR